MKTKIRVLTCNQENFDKLPLLVRRQEFLDWSGLSKDDLAAMVRTGEMPVFKPAGHTQARYYKAELAKLGKWRL